eukprot:412829-Prorocentrum_minimum.AAC.1
MLKVAAEHPDVVFLKIDFDEMPKYCATIVQVSKTIGLGTAIKPSINPSPTSRIQRSPQTFADAAKKAPQMRTVSVKPFIQVYKGSYMRWRDWLGARWSTSPSS